MTPNLVFGPQVYTEKEMSEHQELEDEYKMSRYKRCKEKEGRRVFPIDE